jgi:hypothetical protein
MSIDVDEFREYLQINKHGLDIELSHQPTLLAKVTEEYEAALAKRDMLKDNLAICEANLDITFRRQLKEFTEPKIKSLIISDKLRHQAYSDYHRARLRAGELLALKEGFIARGYMLRELCGLFQANYFERNSSRPTPDTDAVTYQANKAALAAARKRAI